MDIFCVCVIGISIFFLCNGKCIKKLVKTLATNLGIMFIFADFACIFIFCHFHKAIINVILYQFQVLTIVVYDLTQ